MRAFLAIVLIATSLSMASSLSMAVGKTYNFFYVVLTWPQSFCNTATNKCYTPIRPTFTLHGLWPEKNNGPPLLNCEGPEFNITLLRNGTLLSDLDKYWPDLKNPKTNKYLWKHEWVTHGRCSSLFQREYFKSAVKLAGNTENVLNILSSGGIVPGGTYPATTIQSVIKQRGNVDVVVACNGDRYGNLQLYQIYFCANEAGANVVNCTSTTPRGCGKGTNTILFPLPPSPPPPPPKAM